MKKLFSVMLRAGKPFIPQNSRTASRGGVAPSVTKPPSFEKVIMAFLMLLICLSKSEAQSSSTSFLQVLNPSSVTLNSAEQSKLSQIQGLSTTISVQHLQINPIQNYLQVTTLQLELPDGSATLSFIADQVNSLPNGDYYWAGENSDGSTFRIGKYGTELLGNLYVAITGYHYLIQNLSSSKYILVKNQIGYLGGGECGTPVMPDLESDDTVGDRYGCETNTIRILFLFTAAAAASPSGINPVTLAPVIIAELNGSTLASGLTASDISFVSAGAILLPGFAESSNIDNDVVSLAGNTTAIGLRNGAFADIVVLITREGYPCCKVGVARGQTASSELAFVVAQITNAATDFTVTHEIGHLIGARHQRCSNCDYDPLSCDDLTNAHGWDIGDNFKTIMKQLPCSGARIGRWSNPDAPFMGISTGTSSNNNAKKLKDRAPRVACFRATTTPGVGGYEVFVSAPIYICDGDDDMPVSATFGASNFLPPISITWELSATGVGGWMIQAYCNGNQCTLTGLDNFSSDFFVRVTVCDGEGNCVSAMQRVKLVQCAGGGGGDRNSITANTATNDLQVYPNPAADQIQIAGLNGYAEVSITDVSGKTVFQKKASWVSPTPETIDISNLLPGLYLVSVNQGQSVQQTKITKL
ncbi:MAG: zinc-dependent metalloprotease [Saprospiraceae bacterium]